MFYLHQIPSSSLWIWTQHINGSICLRETEWLLTLAQISRILIIQTDLMVCLRCCVERVCVDAVTGSCSGVEINSSVSISVSYKSISRKGSGDECVFGSNDQSWSLRCSPSRYSFRHNNIQTDLSVKSISRRIGVFVDHSAGTLSFYSISDRMTHPHSPDHIHSAALSWV